MRPAVDSCADGWIRPRVSDRTSRGDEVDPGGPATRDTWRAYLRLPWDERYHLIPDKQPGIEATLISCCDDEHCDLVVTTGGTGPAARDVTPEAAAAVGAKMLPGFGEQMRATSLHDVATAILSRQTAGIRGRSPIINVPGRPKSIRECFDAVFTAILYCFELIGAAYLETDKAVVKALRPEG